LLRQSLNYRSLDRGYSYPLFYDTLFADLRTVLAKAATTARQAKRGLWWSDRSRSGLVVRGQTDLEQNGVIYPKLFRRLTEYLRRQGGDLSRALIPRLAFPYRQRGGIFHCVRCWTCPAGRRPGWAPQRKQAIDTLTHVRVRDASSRFSRLMNE
jgi:hypothetical protein